jgi:hypothetical protein
MMYLRRVAFLPILFAVLSAPAFARIDVTLDAESLNGLLASMAPNHVDVSLAGGRGLTIQMQDLKVTAFDPTAGRHGGVATSLRLIVPDLGIDVVVAPHLTLEIADAAGGRKVSMLRFDKVLLDLPLTGSVDVAALLPPLMLMPDTGWIVNSARGKVRVRPNLVDATTGTKNIRLGFTLYIEAAEVK